MDQQSYNGVLWALRFFFVTHLLAPVAGIAIRGGMDRGSDALDRAEWIVNHTTIWRLAWVVWQLAALSDLLLTGALLRWAKGRGSQHMRWAWFGLLFNIIGVIPEQWGEFALQTTFVTSANNASGLAEAFTTHEARLALFTTVCANVAYTAMTICWLRTIRVGRPGRRAWFSVVTYEAAFFFVVASTIAYVGLRTESNYSFLFSLAIGPGFALLLLWTPLAAHTLRLVHGFEEDEDHDARTLTWPTRGTGRLSGFVGRQIDSILNSAGLRDFIRPLPALKMRSDITDVVYLNWLVPTNDAQHLLPSPLQCEDLDGLTAVSILTYRHGHFGPRIFGPLRRLWPSPNHSNWRLYVDDPGDGVPESVYFLTVAVSVPAIVVASRLMADGMPSHPSGRFDHLRDGDTITTTITPDGGSSPSLASTVTEVTEQTLPVEWAARFASWDKAVQYLAWQNRAVGVDRARACVHDSGINIPISISDVRPAKCTNVEMSNIANLVGTTTPFVFVVPNVRLTSTVERSIASI